MKKITPINMGFPSMGSNLDELERLAGFAPGAAAGKTLADQVATRLQQPKQPVPAQDPAVDRLWHIHKRFAALAETGGRAFTRFVGDILDIILSGPIQSRLVNDLIEERLSRIRAEKETDPKHKVPSAMPAHLDIRIGGEPRVFPRNYLKRKFFLASLFLEGDEFPAFKRLMKQIADICAEEWPSADLPPTVEERRAALGDILAELRREITVSNLTRAWALLDRDDFQELEWIYNESRSMHLVRPTFYEDLDKAYREAKKLLKLLSREFTDAFPPTPEKQEAIQDYLNDILEVYTHHHFVLKYFNSVRATISRAELEERQQDLQDRIDQLRGESESLREAMRTLEAERDQAVADARAAKQKAAEVQERLRKCAPEEVERQIRALEAKVKSAQKELQERVEAEAEMQTAFRKLDEEKEGMARKLRDLHAIPDEDALTVKGLLVGKRVVVFGGVGRDHYLPVLAEAGVTEEDYEWYEGYRTISQARTADIVGRCDLIVVITSYAGHLLLYQSRCCITPKQKFVPIHSSGAGSLRQKIRELYQAGPAGNS